MITKIQWSQWMVAIESEYPIIKYKIINNLVIFLINKYFGFQQQWEEL